MNVPGESHTRRLFTWLNARTEHWRSPSGVMMCFEEVALPQATGVRLQEVRPGAPGGVDLRVRLVLPQDVDDGAAGNFHPEILKLSDSHAASR